MFKIFGRKFFQCRSFFSLVKLFSKKEVGFMVSQFFVWKIFYEGVFLKGVIFFCRIYFDNRQLILTKGTTPGYRGDYHQDYPSPRTAPVRNSKVGHYKFMIREVVWLSRPELPRNPTKHNCQVLSQKIIANTDAGNYVLCQIKNVSI